MTDLSFFLGWYHILLKTTSLVLTNNILLILRHSPSYHRLCNGYMFW